MAEYKIPQDAQWGDIDIMERSLDFTGEAQSGKIWLFSFYFPAVTAVIIQNSAVGSFSPKTEGTKTKAVISR
jgi:hypothetical protein